mgnify:CR=1 FL=1
MMTPKPTGSLFTTIKNNIATITFGHPASNSFPSELLNRLTKEYKQARRSFKHNKISRQELFDFEWRLFEINDEISKLERGDLEE